MGPKMYPPFQGSFQTTRLSSGDEKVREGNLHLSVIWQKSGSLTRVQNLDGWKCLQSTAEVPMSKVLNPQMPTRSHSVPCTSNPNVCAPLMQVAIATTVDVIKCREVALLPIWRPIGLHLSSEPA